MIKRLSNIITAIKERMYNHAILRYLCYFFMISALLLYWLYTDEIEVPFVYNAF